MQETAAVENDDVESEEDVIVRQEEAVNGEEEVVSEQDEDAHVHDRRDQDLKRREEQLTNNERQLIRLEIDMLRRENELLRASPASNTSVDSRTTIDIRNVGKLLGKFDGTGEDFQLWKSQVNLLRETYELTESAAKLMVGSKL